MTKFPTLRFRPAALVVAVAALSFQAGPVWADKIKNPVAVFSGLDKITGRIISFQAKIDETVQFGSLQVTPRVCYSRPQTEAPQTDAFAEVDEVQSDKKDKQIFSGWMFAASPGLHGIEHPVYDVWLTDCKGGTQVIADAPNPDQDPNAVASPPATADGSAPAAAAPAAPATPAPKPRRVVRRQEPQPVPQAAEQEHREPSQSFFPTSSYSNEFGGKDPAGR